MVLEAKNITFQYENANRKDERRILHDFSLRMESHERVGIAAPSGFGKTTFCKILAGYERPDRGRYCWTGNRWLFTGTIVRCR